MVWTTRLREAAYTSPSGTRLTFAYDDVGRSVTAKGSVFEFIDADGSYVQDLGRSGRRYPMRIFIAGADYDLVAQQWDTALNERGQGTLEHPMYGPVLVVPFGEIRRRDDLVSAAGQAVFEFDFLETNSLIYPAPVADVQGVISEQLQAADDAQAAQFGSAFLEGVATTLADLRSRYNRALGTVSATLAPVVATVETAQRAFDQIQSSINRGIDVLIGQPLTLAYQTLQLIKTPARIAGQVTARLDAYQSLAQSFTSRTPVNRTALYNEDLFAQATTTAMAQAAVNTAFTRRPDAVLAAEQVLAQMDQLAQWRDEAFEVLGEVDDGAAWQATQELLATVAGALVDQSFDLAAKRAIVLTRPRTIIDVCFEVYGSVDDMLDQFLLDNDFSGDELIEIPRGREVVFYAE